MRTHILGFPSIGKQRELKQALELFWKGEFSAESLFKTCTELNGSQFEWVSKGAGPFGGGAGCTSPR